MATKTSSLIEVPRIEAYGVGDVNRLRSYVFEGEVDTEIANLGASKPLEDLHKLSGALRDQRFIYETGLRQKKGESVEFPEEALHAGRTTYDLFQERDRGNATDDVCDYDSGDKSLSKEGHASVRWVVHPASFKGGQIKLGGQSEVYHILVPVAINDDLRWVLMTDDGLYRTDTGSPFALGARDQAVESLVKRGYDKELAENEVSRFFGRREGQGMAAVSRWSDEYCGPFDVGADFDPGDWDPILGSFLASRSALKGRN